MTAAAYVPGGRPLWSLTEDVMLANGGDNRLIACTRWGDIIIDDHSDLVYESLRRMSLGPVALENVAGVREDFVNWKTGGNEACTAWWRIRQVLDQLAGCVVPSLGLNDGGRPIISAIPLSTEARFVFPRVDDTSWIELIADCAIAEKDDRWVLTAPGAAHQVEVRDPATAVVNSLARGGRTVRAVAVAARIDKSVAADVVAYLAGAGIATISR